jgi:hypothetical protein
MSIWQIRCCLRVVEREFEIIGVAMIRIEKIDSTIEISAKRQIIRYAK